MSLSLGLAMIVGMRADEPRPIAGRELRWVLTVCLFDRGPSSVPELVTMIDRSGFVLTGRASKAVSDALRWEIKHGRVRRLGRGVYGPASIPRQTLSWRRARVRELRFR